jgi:hypothetical protein
MSKTLVREYVGCCFFKMLATVVPSVRKTTVSPANKREMYFDGKLRLINFIVTIPPYERKKNTCTVIFEVLTAVLVEF